MRTLTQLTLLPLLLILITLFLWLFQYQRWRSYFFTNADAVSLVSFMAGQRLLADLHDTDSRFSVVDSNDSDLIARVYLDRFGDVCLDTVSIDWPKALVLRLGERIRRGALSEAGMVLELDDNEPRWISWRLLDDGVREIHIMRFDACIRRADQHPLALTHQFDWQLDSAEEPFLNPGASSLQLFDSQGRIAGHLLIEPNVDVLSMSLRMIAWQWRDFTILLGSLLLLITTYLLLRLALPLARIERALTTSQRPELTNLLQRRDEIGRIARSIDTFFEQQEALKREIEARESAEDSLEKSQWDLRRAMERRVQLARDLHDGMIQEVYSLGLAIKRLKRFFTDSQSEVADVELQRIASQVNAMNAELRALLAELEPIRLKGEQMGRAIERLADSFRKDAGVSVEVDIPDALVAEIPRETRLQVFHIIHEAFANAIRHGKADQLSCQLKRSGQDGLLLQIEDNGQGFDSDLVINTGGRGLRNIQERARAVGMDFSILSQLGGPTRIVLEGL
jgi:signal transduction histidine kinase